MKALLRAPIALYRMGLGSLLGQRFLLLHHVGHKTGRQHENVLEVVEHDQASDTYYVAVGFGPKSHWFKNLQAHPQARIDVGKRALEVNARPLDAAQGGALMVRYAKRNPTAARALAKYMGFEVDGSDGDYAQLPSLGLQFVALEPHAPRAHQLQQAGLQA
jgi:deazaflavin-dependent oxidoreductase (nitroreductase family)